MAESVEFSFSPLGAQRASAGTGAETSLHASASAVFDRPVDCGEQASRELSQSVARHAARERDAREALDALRREHEAILGLAVEGICCLDAQGRITFANPAAAAILGRPVEALSGSSFHADFHHPARNGSPSSAQTCPIAQAIAAGQPLRGVEECLRRGDGAVFPAELSCSPIVENGSVVGAVVMFFDLTDRRRIEEEKRRVEAHLRHTQKLEAIGTLAGGIAHDFNNMLLGILGHCELAMLDVEESSSTYASLREVIKAAGHAKRLAHQILTFSRQVEREKTPVRVAAVVVDTLKLLRATIPATIEIRESISSCETVLADPTQIHQIVMNLCTNAYHAMRDDGGILEIALDDMVPGPDLRAVYRDLKETPYVALCVRDTGHGMTHDVIERIFEPFFTTKAIDEGAGLGLSTVHGIVKDLGGEIAVQSEPGKGSVFTVFIPRCDRPAAALLPRQPEGLRGNGERVLFVDDDSSIAHLGQRMLAALGYAVTVAQRSREALNLFLADPDRFDLIVTDMIMPDLSGEALIREVRALRPQLPVLLVTGYNESLTVERAAEIGVKQYLLKPFASRDLGLAVRSALGRES